MLPPVLRTLHAYLDSPSLTRGKHDCRIGVMLATGRAVLKSLHRAPLLGRDRCRFVFEAEIGVFEQVSAAMQLKSDGRILPKTMALQ